MASSDIDWDSHATHTTVLQSGVTVKKSERDSTVLDLKDKGEVLNVRN